jgi:cytochrome c oxidase cbb3-type subunit 3/ubiquinol-cytochrome c reductase cytochrome c subunit
VVPRPEAELRFDVLYRQNCAGCHGAEGKNGAALEIANPVYQGWIDDASLTRWISNGMPHTQMPAFAISAGGTLTDKQIDALVRGMRQNWARASMDQSHHLPPYLQPADGDADRGRHVFDRACAPCHEASKQEITSPDYLALVSDQALRTIIVVERSNFEPRNSQMEKPEAALNDQDLSDVVKYLGSLRISTPGQPYRANREGAE